MGALKISIPRGFSTYTIRGGFHRAGTRPPVIGHVLTDFRLPTHTSIGALLDQWAAYRGTGPQANRVALELQLWAPPSYIPPRVFLHLPLSPNQPWSDERLANGAVGYRYGFLRYRKALYVVMYWAGRAAPSNDRAAVLRALASIRPSG